jgi:hypothetical protein
MLRRPKHSTIEVVAPKGEEEDDVLDYSLTEKLWYAVHLY